MGGMHDSEYANTNNASDWRGGVVPAVKNSEKISIIYSTTQKKVTFFKNDKAVYVGNGFEGDLYLLVQLSTLKKRLLFWNN